MTIQDFGAIGEVVGGIAVIATLIYLSVQLRQANISTHRSMYAQAATAVSDFWLSLARDYVLYENFIAMLRDPDTLSDQDLQKGYLVMDAYLSLMESYYLHNKEYGEDLSQQRWGRQLQRMFGAPGGRQYWTLRRPSFHAEFAEYIDALINDDG